MGKGKPMAGRKGHHLLEHAPSRSEPHLCSNEASTLDDSGEGRGLGRSGLLLEPVATCGEMECWMTRAAAA
jgi:hypothetical protein